MSTEERELLDQEIKGITGRFITRLIVGWTAILISIAGTYFALRSDIMKLGAEQGKVDLIQNSHIEEMQRNDSRQDLEMQKLETLIENIRENLLENK